MYNLKVWKNVIYIVGFYFGLDVSFDDLDVIFGIFMVGLN